MKHRTLAVVCFALSAAVQLFFSQETELFYMFLFFSLGVVEYTYSFPKLRARVVWCFTPEASQQKRDDQVESHEG